MKTKIMNAIILTTTALAIVQHQKNGKISTDLQSSLKLYHDNNKKASKENKFFSG